jgi:hypothetical protein
MRKHASAVLLIVLTAAPALTLGADTPVRPEAAASQELPISRALYFREIALDLRDGTSVRGRLSAATAASIRVMRGGRNEDYDLKDIRRIVIHSEARRSRGVLPGIMFGLYAGNAALLSGDDDPGFYADPPYGSFSLGLVLAEGVFAAIGGGLGWLANFGGGEQAFEFPADFSRAPGASERFARFLSGEQPPARVHLWVQDGFLVSGVTRRFGAFAAANGFTLAFAGSSPTRFSLLRGLELSYAVLPRWRTGLRLSFPSEPFFRSYERTGGVDGSSTYLNQDFRATALHAVGAFELAGWTRGAGLAASLGAGAGLAWVRLTRAAFYSGISSLADIRKTLPSAVVFGNVSYRLTPFVSIGLAADYTFIPAVTVQALSGNALSGGSQGLSNGSIGFILGYHF